MAQGFRRYCIGVSYVGTKYCGWAEQVMAHPRKENSIEGVLMESISDFAGTGNATNFKGSSRTDLGVHAVRNVFQVDLYRQGGSAGFHTDMIRGGLNHNIDRFKHDIAITDVEEVGADFDARSAAVGRTYMYRILCAHERSSENIRHNLRFKRGGMFHRDRAWSVHEELDTLAMHHAGQFLLGEQDFSSFRNSGCQSSTPYRNISHVQIATQCFHELSVGTVVEPDQGTNIATSSPSLLALDDHLLMQELRSVTVTVRADAFLHKMVRNIGTYALITYPTIFLFSFELTCDSLRFLSQLTSLLIPFYCGTSMTWHSNVLNNKYFLVGALVEVGRGNLTANDMTRLLALRNRARINIPPAPAHGLYLMNVHY